MYTVSSLLDIHDRCHKSLRNLLKHCESLSPDEFTRSLDGFGVPSVQSQLHHEIGAERYWVGVLLGRMDVDEKEADGVNIAALERLRAEVSANTVGFLQSCSDETVNQARKVVTWGGHERELAPAHVIMRTQTHLFHHQGQVLAMCRILGKPAKDLPYSMDYPII